MGVVSLTEVYADPNVQERLRVFPYERRHLDDHLNILSDFGGQEDPLGYLDRLASDPDKYLSAQSLLQALEPRVILEHYGTNTLAWIAVNAVDEDTDDSFKDALRDQAGFDRDLFNKAHRVARKNMGLEGSIQLGEYGPVSGREVLHGYKVMDRIINGKLEIDLPNILGATARHGIEISGKRSKDYSLVTLRATYDRYYVGGQESQWCREEKNGDGFIDWDVWLDTPIGIALAYKGRPNAFVGIEPRGTDRLMIRELQGVIAKRGTYSTDDPPEKIVTGKISARGLPPLNWQSSMIRIAEELANITGISSIGIQAGKHNPWHTIGRKLSKEQVIRLYDVPAYTNGYNPDNDGDWYKLLPMSATTRQNSRY